MKSLYIIIAVIGTLFVANKVAAANAAPQIPAPDPDNDYPPEDEPETPGLCYGSECDNGYTPAAPDPYDPTNPDTAADIAKSQNLCALNGFGQFDDYLLN